MIRLTQGLAIALRVPSPRRSLANRTHQRMLSPAPEEATNKHDHWKNSIASYSSLHTSSGTDRVITVAQSLRLEWRKACRANLVSDNAAAADRRACIARDALPPLAFSLLSWPHQCALDRLCRPFRRLTSINLVRRTLYPRFSTHHPRKYPTD